MNKIPTYGVSVASNTACDVCHACVYHATVLCEMKLSRGAVISCLIFFRPKFSICLFCGKFLKYKIIMSLVSNSTFHLSSSKTLIEVLSN